MQLLRLTRARGLARLAGQQQQRKSPLKLLVCGVTALILKHEIDGERQAAFCDASALSPPEIAAEAIQAQTESTLSWLRNKVSDGVIYLLDKAGRLIKVILRGGVLSILFFPSAITSPVAILQTDPEWWWDLLRSAIRSSGPCFIKLSQWIATRPDLFPLYVCTHLQVLQDRGGSLDCSWEEVEELMSRELGENWSEGLEVERTPEGLPLVLGSGCIAQVLKGRLRGGNNNNNSKKPNTIGYTGDREVAIKFVRSGVRERIEDDIGLMAALTGALQVSAVVCIVSETACRGCI